MELSDWSRGAETPPFFSVKAMQKARKLVTELEDGADSIAFSGPDGETVEPTKLLAANVKSILKRTFYVTQTALEGRLETVDVHGKFSFAIYDTLNNHRTKCLFSEGMFDQVASSLRRRVAVAGEAKFNRRTGRSVSIRAESLRRLGETSDLPKFKHGDYIDITGGIDSAEYIRRIRDAE